mgnify:CR=1 FL=1
MRASWEALHAGLDRSVRTLQADQAFQQAKQLHPALAAFELFAAARRAQPQLDEPAAWQQVCGRTVFTTHTPVPAGNETYLRDELLTVLGRYADTLPLAAGREGLLSIGRIDPADAAQPSGLTPLALRCARQANAVSRRHGEVARAMWQPLFPGRAPEGVPITHVTNGVHVPSWLQGPMRELLDRHLGPGWMERAHDPASWAPVADIPAAELPPVHTSAIIAEATKAMLAPMEVLSVWLK